MKASTKSCTTLSVPELKAMCKEHEVRGFSSMKKPELVKSCCLPFTSELGATSAELGTLEKKELSGKVETIATLKDVVKQKMVIANAWLENFKKTQKKDFEYGPLTSRHSTIQVDPVYRESRGYYSSEQVVDYYKAIIETRPFSVLGNYRDDEGYKFSLSGDSVVTCLWHGTHSKKPCVTESGRKFMLEKDEKTKKLVKATNLEEYYKKELENETACLYKPEKCAINNGNKVAILDRFTSALSSASNGLDELKNVIQKEKERMKNAEVSSKEKQAKAKESLKGWGKL
jgi:hypothetical protein